MSVYRPGEIIESITVEDVTEDKERIDIAFRIAATNYAKLSSRPLDAHEVRTELCDDIYHEKRLARTLLATGIDPLTGERGPVGTIRVVMSPQQGMNGDISPLEAMSLISPPEGWARFQSGKFDAFKCAEIGRFVIISACRSDYGKEIGLPAVIAGKLVRKSMCISSRAYGKAQLWAIMPPSVVKLAEDAGLPLLTKSEIVLNHQKHAELFQKYDNYWLKGNPKFYEFALCIDTEI